MVLEIGDKVHVVYRALYEKSTRRHFAGEVIAVEGALCRLQGFAFVYDARAAKYLKKPEPRITICDLGEAGYLVNVISPEVNLDDLHYKYVIDEGLIATDGKDFILDIHEFGSRS